VTPIVCTPRSNAAPLADRKSTRCRRRDSTRAKILAGVIYLTSLIALHSAHKQ